MEGVGVFEIGVGIIEGNVPSCREGDIGNQTGVSTFGTGALYISNVPS